MGAPTGSGARIEYLRPLERAWARSRLILLTPFDLGKWLGIGFAAWLANLAGGGGTSFSYRGHVDLPLQPDNLEELWRHLTRIVPWPSLLGIGLVGIVLALLVLWLSSRGKFVFLHDVARDRAEIALPWREYARQGDSLFRFRLGLLAAALVLAAGIVALALGAAGAAGRGSLVTPVTLAIALATVGAMLVLALVSLYTESFVVPIMYRFRTGALDAWRVLLRWFAAYPWAFVAYALFVLALGLAVGITIVVLGLLTCCIGLLLLAIPYLGTVLTLPLWVAYRALGPEFLAQFHPDFDIFSAPPPPAPGAGAEPVAGYPPPAATEPPPAPPPAPL